MTHHEIKMIGGPFDGAVAEFDFTADKQPEGSLEFSENMVYNVDPDALTATYVSGTLTDEDRANLRKLTG